MASHGCESLGASWLPIQAQTPCLTSGSDATYDVAPQTANPVEFLLTSTACVTRFLICCKMLPQHIVAFESFLTDMTGVGSGRCVN
jgi:hypothetical protein